MRLSISDRQQPWPYLSPFLRYGDLSVKNAHFSYPAFVQHQIQKCSSCNVSLKFFVRRELQRV